MPQAIAGVLSVFFLYVLINDIFDERAGLISAFVLAITPIFVALSRNNTMDMQVVLIIILATLAFFQAIQKKSFKYLLFTFILIGLGFNIKMLLAFIILPAVGIVWLLNRHIPIKKRLMQITTAGLVLLVVSLSWISIVELYPKENRPYIGSTENNSAFELAFSYNGLLRIASPFYNYKKQFPSSSFYSFAPGGVPLELGETGAPGILRLFNKELAGQISWFFPIIFIGLFLLFMDINNKSGADIKKLSILYWFLWLIPYSFYLSFTTGIFHRYYVAALAPPIAALCGVISTWLWDLYSSNEESGFLFPAAIFLTGLLQFYIINNENYGIPKYSGFIILIIVSVISTLLILKKLSVRLINKLPDRFLYIPVILVLCAAPFYWACTPLVYGGNFVLPYASPELSNDIAKGANFIKNDQIRAYWIKPLYDFLAKNRNNEKYLAAVPSVYAYAVLLILFNENKNIPVMAVGGFAGKDPVINLEELKKYIKDGDIRFFLVPSFLEHSKEKGNMQLYQWVIEHGKLVDKKLWNDYYIPNLFIPDSLDLYDLKI